MLEQIQSLACPVCGHSILFSVFGLLKGERFSCPECHATISLPSESKPAVREAMEKFDKLKGQMSSGPKE